VKPELFLEPDVEENFGKQLVKVADAAA